MKRMKNVIFITVLLCLLGTKAAIAQVYKVTHEAFTFKISSDYGIVDRNALRVNFNDTIKIDDVFLIKGLMVSVLDIDLKENEIETVADFSKLERLRVISFEPEISMEIEGLTNISGRDLYYFHSVTEVFTDNREALLVGYDHNINYYFLDSGNAYVLRQYYRLYNPNESKYDRYPFVKQMKRHTDIGDINKVLSTLKIKK